MSSVRLADDSRQLSKVGLCAGSGGDLVSAALSQGADAFVTGEMRHHDALAAAAKGLTVICTLHSNRCELLAPLAVPCGSSGSTPCCAAPRQGQVVGVPDHEWSPEPLFCDTLHMYAD